MIHHKRPADRGYFTPRSQQCNSPAPTSCSNQICRNSSYRIGKTWKCCSSSAQEPQVSQHLPHQQLPLELRCSIVYFLLLFPFKQGKSQKWWQNLQKQERSSVSLRKPEHSMRGQLSSVLLISEPAVCRTHHQHHQLHTDPKIRSLNFPLDSQ